MKRITDKMEWLLELGGTKRDIVFLVISGVALLASMLHLQPQPLLQILGNRFPRTVQLLFVRAKEDNIIHVSHAVHHAVERRDVTVERFQIEVCKPLADEKANGQPLFAGLQDLPRQL